MSEIVASATDDSLPRMLSSERAASSVPASSDLAFHLRHALMGFAAGLVIVVPVTLWLTGRIGSPQTLARTPAVVIAPVAVRPMEQFKGGALGTTPTPATAPASQPPAVTVAMPAPPGPSAMVPAPPGPTTAATSLEAAAGPPAAAADNAMRPAAVQQAAPAKPDTDTELMEVRLEAARSLVSEGDVLGARAVLAEAALASIPEAAYVLAETYDPNVLAALGITDVRAEVELARLFYERALTGGVSTARQRLEALR